ncbi:MAG: hypothetical protein ACJ0G3_04000 [Dehalococcoidia bacterium]
MAIEKIIDNNEDNHDEIKKIEKNDVEDVSSDLRPKILNEYVGQINIVTSLKTAIQASEGRNEAMDHVLFHGPPRFR